MKAERTPPTEIDGQPVVVCSDPHECLGGRWVCLAIEHDDDSPLWEFDLWSGRLIMTQEAGQ